MPAPKPAPILPSAKLSTPPGLPMVRHTSFGVYARFWSTLAGVWIGGCLLLLGLTSSVAADPPAKPDQSPVAEDEGKEAEEADRYIRITKQNDRPAALQTSILRYVPTDKSRWANSGLTIDLIGAVHVGEKSYYDSLNREFARYDAMLFELVAPEGTVIPKGGGERRGGNPISALQGGLKSMLALEFQLEQIDYTKPNFVHADMTPDEMAASMKKRGESVLTMLFKMLSSGFGKAGQPNDVEIFMALFAKDRSVRLKRVMAKQVVDMETLNAALAGPDGSSTLIGERNRKALEVMSREIDQNGKRRIAIFYGAGHLPDFDRRLLKEFQLKRVDNVRWLTAWDLTK
ncbi:MAG: hypothetical protein KDB14_28840 [Planctomycetales bacterium]|nr:hypothetical protein [Planctomycetales bacterium]